MASQRHLQDTVGSAARSVPRTGSTVRTVCATPMCPPGRLGRPRRPPRTVSGCTYGGGPGARPARKRERRRLPPAAAARPRRGRTRRRGRAGAWSTDPIRQAGPASGGGRTGTLRVLGPSCHRCPSGLRLGDTAAWCRNSAGHHGGKGGPGGTRPGPNEVLPPVLLEHRYRSPAGLKARLSGRPELLSSTGGIDTGCGSGLTASAPDRPSGVWRRPPGS